MEMFPYCWCVDIHVPAGTGILICVETALLMNVFSQNSYCSDTADQLEGHEMSTPPPTFSYFVPNNLTQ